MVSRNQIKQAIEVLTQACDENFLDLKNELRESISIAKGLLEESEQKIKLLSYDAGKSQYQYGFTQEYVANLKHNHSSVVVNFIINWCIKQSDWRVPWCWISSNHIKYIEHAVKSHLVYVCSNKFDQQAIKQHVITTLGKLSISNPQMFRIKPLEFTGHIRDHDVPYNQIGTLISLDYVPYLSIEQIHTLIESISKVLRPGGQALMHYSNGDGEQEWNAVMKKLVTFCNKENLREICEKFNLNAEFYDIDDFYSFAVLSKPGEKTSIKSSLTKIEQITNTK